jgi:hypothetical protein
MRLENPEHVMETQRIAQIEHEQSEVNEQKHEGLTLTLALPDVSV